MGQLLSWVGHRSPWLTVVSDHSNFTNLNSEDAVLHAFGPFEAWTISAISHQKSCVRSEKIQTTLLFFPRRRLP
jgi:hypothetical protein